MLKSDEATPLVGSTIFRPPPAAKRPKRYSAYGVMHHTRRAGGATGRIPARTRPTALKVDPQRSARPAPNPQVSEAPYSPRQRRL